MKLFKLAGDYTAACEWEKTRYGFRHVAVLLHKGDEVGRAKQCYYNRTWESFPFETVLVSLCVKYFKGKDAIQHIDIVRGGNKQ